MTVAERLGVAKMYDYIEAFGFMEKTGIDLPGEAKGIVYNEKNVGPVELATMSFWSIYISNTNAAYKSNFYNSK